MCNRKGVSFTWNTSFFLNKSIVMTLDKNKEISRFTFPFPVYPFWRFGREMIGRVDNYLSEVLSAKQ